MKCWFELICMFNEESHASHKTMLRMIAKVLQGLNEILQDQRILTWHFFSEPHGDICLRIKADSSDHESLKGMLKRELIAMDIESPFIYHFRFSGYEDEVAYGECWEEVSWLFEAGSKLALGLIRKSAPKLLNPAKLVHCLLNSWGFSRDEELEFYRACADIQLSTGIMELSIPCRKYILGGFYDYCEGSASSESCRR